MHEFINELIEHITKEMAFSIKIKKSMEKDMERWSDRGMENLEPCLTVWKMEIQTICRLGAVIEFIKYNYFKKNGLEWTEYEEKLDKLIET